MMAIATIMAVYGGDDPQYFREAIQSIITQELDSDCESRIYLGVDGPIGEPLESVILENAGNLHRVVRSNSNRGLAATLNTLINSLEDEVFVFRMDADDVSLPTRYQMQIMYMEENQKIDILGTAITEFGPGISREREVRFARSSREALKYSHRRVPVAHPTVCFRRSVFDRVHSYPERGTNEDVAFWFACMRAGLTFDNLPYSLLRFRIGPGFWQRRGTRKAWLEFCCYVSGIRTMHGFMTLRYLYPLGRLVMRLAPSGLSKILYSMRSNSRT